MQDPDVVKTGARLAAASRAFNLSSNDAPSSKNKRKPNLDKIFGNLNLTRAIFVHILQPL